MNRPINAIARDIKANWPKPNYAAVPYLQALLQLETPADYYGCDDGKSIAIYFLGNATTWRGEQARALKAELKQVYGIK